MKKIVLSLLSIIFLLSSFTITQAADSERILVDSNFSEEDYLESHIDNTVFEWGNPTPFYDHVSTVILGFDISGNKAECVLSVTGYPEVNKISTYIYLQRYVLGKWTTITGGSFRKESNSSNLIYAPTKSLDTIGTYRFTAQIFVYTKDGSVEIVEEASNTEVY